MKEILLVARCNLKKVCYCPFIYPLVSNLLIYLNPSEIYHILCEFAERDYQIVSDSGLKMNEHSTGACGGQKQVSLRDCMHLTLHKELYVELVCSFIVSYEDQNKSFDEGLERFEAIGVESYEYVKMMVDSFFTNVFPYDFIDDVMMDYLTSGISVLLKLVIVFFVFYCEEIKSSSSEKELKEKIGTRRVSLDKKDFGTLVGLYSKSKVADKISLHDNNQILVDIKMKQTGKNYLGTFYRTQKLLDESKLSSLTPLAISKLLEEVPGIYRSTTLRRIFANWRDGNSIRYMIEQTKDYPDAPMFIFIVSTKSEEIGFYLSSPIEITGTEFKSDIDSFVFKMGPEFQAYHNSNNNKNNYRCTEEFIEVGMCEKGNSIYLYEGMSKGISSPCDSFASPSLIDFMDASNGFQVSFVEVFVLV